MTAYRLRACAKYNNTKCLFLSILELPAKYIFASEIRYYSFGESVSSLESSFKIGSEGSAQG